MTLAAAATCLLLLASPAAPGPTSERLPDGLELIVHPLPGAERASLRLVVRSGGARDPAHRAGLAHLVEHLAFGGNYEEGGAAVFAAARAAGAELNAHTTPDLTKFELDAPAAAFDALASRLLRLVTDPAWERARLEAERGVLETEADYVESEGLLTLVDWALFPSPAQDGPLGGTSDSRAQLGLEDVERFYAAEYVPENMAIVLTGAVTAEGARRLVAGAFGIPPGLPGAHPPHPVERPVLPREQRLMGGVTVTLLGYALDPADRGACQAVAALAELRLTLALSVNGPMVPGVSASCPMLRGTPLLLAAVYTTTLDAGDLPAEVGAILAGLASPPPTAAERAAVDARVEARERRLLADPAAVADRLAFAAADEADPRPLAARLHPAGLPDARGLAQLVGRSVVPARRFLVHVSPTEE